MLAWLLALSSLSRPAEAASGVALHPYWTSQVTGNLTALLPADLDHDGWSEILGGTDQGQVVLWGAEGRPRWEFEVETDWVSRLSTSDLDGDGRDEVLVMAAGILPTSYLYVLRSDGSLGWKYSVRGEAWAALPFNLDEDPSLEILLAVQRPAVLDDNGTRLSSWPVQFLKTPFVRLADWDGDGADEVVSVTPQALSVVEVDGSSTTYPLSFAGEIRDVEIGDVDRGEGLELCVLTDTELLLFGNDGALRWKRPLQRPPGSLLLQSAPAETQGKPRMIVSSAAGMTAIDASGNEIWQFESRTPWDQPFEVTEYDSLLLASATGGQAYLLDSRGDRLAEYNLLPGSPQAQLADLNGDGHPEVLLSAGGELSLFGVPDRNPVTSLLWTYPARGPVVGLLPNDVDGDRRSEVLLEERNGSATILDRNGQLVWQHPPEKAKGGFAVDSGGGFLAWEGSDLHRYDGQGVITWETIAPAAILQSMDTLDGVLVLTVDGGVSLFSREDGASLWESNLGSPASGLAASGSQIAVLQGDSVGLFEQGGALVKHVSLGRPAEEVVFIPGGGLLVRAGGHLFSLDREGRTAWEWLALPAERLLDLDAGSELIAIGTDARLVVLDAAGIEAWSQPSSKVVSAVSVVDTDGDGREEIAAGDVQGAIELYSSTGQLLWHGAGRERVNVLAQADLNGDSLSEILAGFEDGDLSAFGQTLNQPPWLDAPAVTTVGSGYQYSVRVHDPDGDQVQVTLEIWDPSGRAWRQQNAVTAGSGSGTLNWSVSNPFDTWDAGKNSAFRFVWQGGRSGGRTAAYPGPLTIPVAPWYFVYGRILGLVALVAAVIALLLILIYRSRRYRRSALGQAEAALLRLILDPGETLTEFHRLLSDENQALELLEHLPGLAREKGETALGDLLEGAHLALARPEVMPEALKAVTGALGHLKDVPAAEKTHQIYTIFHEVLSTDSLSDFGKLRQPLGELAESARAQAPLKPLASVLERLAGIARTMLACEQADSSNDRIAYLAGAAADLGEMERFASAELTGLESQAASSIARHWLEVTRLELEGLRGRAEIHLALHTRQFLLREEGALEITLTNSGRSPATDLVVELLPEEGLKPASQSTMASLLTPGASLPLTLPVHLAASPGTFAVTFRVRWDDREQAGKQATFTEHIRLIPAPGPLFVPIPNPYTTGRPLGPGSPLFVGRQDLIDFIQEKLAGDHILVLVGERRLGKTSLLRQLPARLGNDWVVAYLDGQGLGLDGGLASWLADAALEVARAAGNSNHPALGDFESQPGATFEDFLKRVLASLSEGQRLLVLLDEFEEIEARVRMNSLPAAIFPYLRHLMRLQGANFILAGTQRLESLSPEFWTPLFNIGIYREIGPLDWKAARHLVTAPVEGYLLYDDLAVSKLFRLSGGNPYFLQLLCHCVVAHCNREHLPYVTDAEVDPATEDALAMGQAHLRFLWESASSQGRQVLSHLAWFIADGQFADRESIAARLVASGSEADTSSLEETLANLIRYGLITRLASGGYRFSADLVRVWIEKKSGIPGRPIR